MTLRSIKKMNMSAQNEKMKQLRTDVFFVAPTQKFLESIKSEDSTSKASLAMLSYLYDVGIEKISSLKAEIYENKNPEMTEELKKLLERLIKLVQELEAEMAKRTMKADIEMDKFYSTDPMLDVVYGHFVRQASTLVQEIFLKDESVRQNYQDLKTAIGNKLLLAKEEKELIDNSVNEDRKKAIDTIIIELQKLMVKLIEQ